MTGWWATLTDAERAAVLLMLQPDEVFMHRDVSLGMLSTSLGMLSTLRYYGGGNINNKRFSYIETSDELVREDVLALVKSMRKTQGKAKRDEAKAAAKAAQGSLL